MMVSASTVASAPALALNRIVLGIWQYPNGNELLEHLSSFEWRRHPALARSTVNKALSFQVAISYF